MEVVGDEVVVTVIDNPIDKRGELPRVAESSIADLVKDGLELRVELEITVVVVVAEVFDVF